MLIQVTFIVIWTTSVSCTIAGLSYMDPINQKPLSQSKPLSETDACNPLYWYPRSIPEYCYYKTPSKPGQKPAPVPLPIPIPIPPQPIPIPLPIAPMPPAYPAPPFPMLPGFQMPAAPMISPLPMPNIQPPMPLPFGIPIAPSNLMLPSAGMPAFSYPGSFPMYRSQYNIGIVPGIPGMVTHDGGINVLPFSDAYADLLAKHKHAMLRKKLKKVFNDYDDYPHWRREDKRGHRH